METLLLLTSYFLLLASYFLLLTSCFLLLTDGVHVHGDAQKGPGGGGRVLDARGGHGERPCDKKSLNPLRNTLENT